MAGELFLSAVIACLWCIPVPVNSQIVGPVNSQIVGPVNSQIVGPVNSQIVGPVNQDLGQYPSVINLRLISADCNTPIDDATLSCRDCFLSVQSNGSFSIYVRNLPAVVDISHPKYIGATYRILTSQATLVLQCAVGTLCSCSLFHFDIKASCAVPLTGVTVTSPDIFRADDLSNGRYRIKACKLPATLTLSSQGYATSTVVMTQTNSTFVMTCNAGLGCIDDILTVQVTSDCVENVPGVAITSPDVQNVEALCPGLYHMIACNRPANLTFSKYGFSTTNQVFTQAFGEVMLGCSGRPFLKEEVQSKTRQVDQSAQFCCWAEVEPSSATLKYKWYFNGAEIPGQTSMMLTKTNILPTDAGNYKCKAYTDIGGFMQSIMSEEASLTIVADVTDFSAARVDLISEIVPGCMENIGSCTPRACKTNIAAAEECIDDGYVCPDVIGVAPITCAAPGGLFNFNTITSCKCCLRQMTTVNLEVVGSDGMKIKDAVVSILDDVIGQTDINGLLSTKIKPGTRRLVIEVVDETEQYINTIEIFTAEEFSVGPIAIEITLVKRANPIIINPLIENTLSLNGAAQIVIPANSACSLTGEPYQDPITVYFTFLDPANLTEIRLSPGEFVAADENGQLQNLVTRGVFHITFRDSAGNILAVKTLMVRDDDSMELWTLGKDGTWVPASASNGRKKRDFEIGSLGSLNPEPGGKFNWYNVDRFPGNESKLCWMKIRVYDTSIDPPTEIAENPNALFKPKIEVFNTNFNYISLTYNPYTTNIASACYKVRCDLTIQESPDTFGIIRLFAKYPLVNPIEFAALPFALNDLSPPIPPIPDLMYTLVGNTIETKFYSSLPGPFFESSDVCESATADQQAFRFGIVPPAVPDYDSDNRCVIRIAYTGSVFFLEFLALGIPPIRLISQWDGINGIRVGTQTTSTRMGKFEVYCVEIECNSPTKMVSVKIADDFGGEPGSITCSPKLIILPPEPTLEGYYLDTTGDVNAAITDCQNSNARYAAVVDCELPDVQRG